MSVPSLRDTQRWMKARILPAGPAARGAGRPGGRADDGDAAVVLSPQRGTPGLERLDVYAGGYRARMREALAEVYEAVRHLVGEAAFARLAEAYAARHPSHDYNLTLAGRHLAEFLRDDGLTASLPFLPDLARLEWAVCEAFHATEQPRLHASRCAAWTPETWAQATLTFQPSIHVVRSAWPILDLWEARARPRETINIGVVDRPQDVLVHRREWRVVCEPLEPAHAHLLAALLAGHTLGAACAALAAVDPPQLTAWCARWMSDGFLTDVKATLYSA